MTQEETERDARAVRGDVVPVAPPAGRCLRSSWSLAREDGVALNGRGRVADRSDAACAADTG
jgi:hypothetical protein